MIEKIDVKKYLIMYPYTRYIVLVDDRGKGLNVARRYKTWMNQHPQIAKNYALHITHAPADVVVIDRTLNDVLLIAEIKMNADLDSSLNKKSLRRELEETYKPLQTLHPNAESHVIAGGKYTQTIMARLVGLMNKYPYVQTHIAGTTDKMFDKLDEIIRKNRMDDEEKMVVIPTLLHTVNKGFALSFASLSDGVSVPLGHHLALNWDRSTTEKELSEYIDDFYNDGRNYGELAANLYYKIQQTWLKEEC